MFQSKKAQEENTLYSLEFKNKKAFKCRYTWINNLCYKKHSIHWFECIEIPKNQTSKDKAARFVYLSSFEVTPDAILEMTKTGRLRWKIENEGFNTQKNHGYHMSHQYSRSSFDAFKNYYQCMQIAHIINQLYEKGSLLKPLLIAKMSLVKLWDIMMGEMRGGELDFNFFNDLLELRIQISFR